MANEKLVGLICRRVAGPAGGPYVGIREIVSALAAALRDDPAAVEAMVAAFMRNLSSGAVMDADAAAKQARQALCDYLTKGD